MPRATSGVVILAESFSNAQFKESYKKFFSKDANGVMSTHHLLVANPQLLSNDCFPAVDIMFAPALTQCKTDMGFNAVVEVQTSKELRVCGAIGHVTSLNKKTPQVSADTVRIFRYTGISTLLSCS